MPAGHVAQALNPGGSPIRYRSSAAQTRRDGVPRPQRVFDKSRNHQAKPARRLLIETTYPL